MLTVLGNPQRVCNGLTRRAALQVGGAGLFGLTAAKLHAAESATGHFRNGRAKSVMFLFLFGGPSQLETFAMKPDSPRWGRGHWSYCFPAVVAGTGVRGGLLLGKSDKDAAWPMERPISPEDLGATIYEALGVDRNLALPDKQGRIVYILDGGRPGDELWG